MKSLFMVVLVSTSILSGCATHGTRAALTSGQVGCPTSEIKVTEGDIGWTTNTWKAECGGITYYCTYMSSYNLGSSVQCKEAVQGNL